MAKCKFKSKTINIQFTPEEYDNLSILAKHFDISRAELVRRLLSEKVQSENIKSSWSDGFSSGSNQYDESESQVQDLLAVA